MGETEAAPVTTNEPFREITAFMDTSGEIPSWSDVTPRNSALQTSSRPSSRASDATLFETPARPSARASSPPPLAEFWDPEEVPLLAGDGYPRPEQYILGRGPTGRFAALPVDVDVEEPRINIASRRSSLPEEGQSHTESLYSGETLVGDPEEERDPLQTWLAPEDRLIDIETEYTVESVPAASLPASSSNDTPEHAVTASGPYTPPSPAAEENAGVLLYVPDPHLRRGPIFLFPDSDDEEDEKDAVASLYDEPQEEEGAGQEFLDLVGRFHLFHWIAEHPPPLPIVDEVREGPPPYARPTHQRPVREGVGEREVDEPEAAGSSSSASRGYTILYPQATVEMEFGSSYEDLSASDGPLLSCGNGEAEKVAAGW